MLLELVLGVPVGLAVLVLWLTPVSDLISLYRSLTTADTGEERTSPSPMPRLLFLVPAHNEEKVLASCLRSLQRVQYPTDRYDVLVVADNCSDDTAGVARDAGVPCLVRDAPDARGKPQALAWALERVELDDFEAVVIVDADAVVDGEFASALATVPDLHARAVQGYHDVRNPAQSYLTELARVLVAGWYQYAYPLKNRAGLSAPLTGPGTCIGTTLLQETGWPAFTIAEDTELYVELTLRGIVVACEPRARVYSEQAGSLDQARTQRTRWRSGRFVILRRYFRRIVESARISWHQKLDLIGELASPGPVAQLGLALVLAAAWWGVAESLHATVTVGLLLPSIRPAAYAVAGLTRVPRPGRAMRAFAVLPLYMVWRVWVEIVALVTAEDQPWTRTRRS